MSYEQPSTSPGPAQLLTPAEERQWAMLSHFSVLLNLFTVFLGTLAPLIIYLVYKESSRFVAFHSLQALIFQSICWFGGSVFAVASGFLSGIIPGIGLVCLPLTCIFAVLPVVALVYGVVGGIHTNQGQDFKYWLVGDWVQSALST